MSFLFFGGYVHVLADRDCIHYIFFIFPLLPPLTGHLCPACQNVQYGVAVLRRTNTLKSADGDSASKIAMLCISSSLKLFSYSSWLISLLLGLLAANTQAKDGKNSPTLRWNETFLTSLVLCSVKSLFFSNQSTSY